MADRVLTRSVLRIAAAASLVVTTPHLGGAMQTGAQLGGGAAAFTAKLGPPVRDTGLTADYQKCPGRTAVARWGITIDNGHVTTILRNACPGEKLDPVDAAREAAPFVPVDATQPRPFKTDEGAAASSRRSASLAKNLPASAFQTCKGAAVPGTFSYQLSPERQSWMLTLGTCL